MNDARQSFQDIAIINLGKSEASEPKSKRNRCQIVVSIFVLVCVCISIGYLICVHQGYVEPCCQDGVYLDLNFDF